MSGTLRWVFDGVLTAADQKQHVPLVFDVPPGTTRLVGTFAASPRRATGAAFDNLVSLSVFGPKGARGARHNNPQMDFAIDAYSATPGYVAGPIEPGRWMVFMDTFRVLGPDPYSYTLTVAAETGQVQPRAPYVPGTVASRGPGWYRGDLHAHTLHSDGSWQIADLVAWARSRKLDFLTLSDHNTVSGHEELHGFAGDDLLTIGGLELTTHAGHALSLGGSNWHEWRAGPVSGRTMPTLAGDVIASGSLFVIAHPLSPGDPECTGCRWDYQDMMPGPARIVEIWNGGPWSDYNEAGLALYRRWLAEGRRLVATAGSDIHGPTEANAEIGFNNVDATELSEAAILAAVRAGRNYLSSGPRLNLEGVDRGGRPVPMGGEISAAGQVEVHWADVADDLELRIVGAEGGIVETRAVGAGSTGKTLLEALPTPFVMAELRDAAGRLHAITNPIFVR